MTKRFMVLGLVVAVCVCGPLGSGSARAASHWTVGTNNPFTGERALKETITLTKRETSEPATTTELTVPELGLTLTSTGLKVVGGKIKETNKGAATKFSFTGVTVTGAAGCVVSDKATGTAGTLNTQALKIELADISTHTFSLITAMSGKEITNIVLTKAQGKNCAAAGEYPVEGTIATEFDQNTMNIALHTESDRPTQEESTKIIKFKGASAYLDVNGDLELTSGETWGVATAP